jgi:hypothetical protein
VQVQKPQVFAAEVRGPPVILRCKQWEDFQTLARQAQALSFLYKEAEKAFQADALKNNQIITYSGELAKTNSPFKELGFLGSWTFLKTRFLRAY